MPVPEKILQLVERFDANSADYKRSTYNETQTRREFIDPFFMVLGWDVDNSQGKPETQKEVIHEAKVLVDDAQKAPDYCFRLAERQYPPGVSVAPLRMERDLARQHLDRLRGMGGL